MAATLEQSLKLPCGVTVPNRLLKSAMSEGLGGPQGQPTEELVRLYARWAEGGIGVCVTGNVMIDRNVRGEPGNVVLDDDRDLALVQRWAEAGRAHGTALWMQINHPGRQVPRGLNPGQSVAPSAVPFRDDLKSFFGTPRALTEAEVEQLIVRYGTTAGLAKRAGFTGVQIHGAHGYLVSQFLSPHVNRREDKWGGTPDKRRRFVLAVYDAMRSAVGPSFPVSIKLNSADFQRGGFTEEESLDVVSALGERGIDLIEISGGTYEAPAMALGDTKKDSTRAREAYFLEFAAKARARVKAPLAVTGGFRTRAGIADALASGQLDMIGLGRALALDPDFPKKLLRGEQVSSQVRPIRTGIAFVDRAAMMEVAYYTRQLHRMGKGKAPRADENPKLAFLGTVAAMGVGTLFTRLRA